MSVRNLRSVAPEHAQVRQTRNLEELYTIGQSFADASDGVNSIPVEGKRGLPSDPEDMSGYQPYTPPRRPYERREPRRLPFPWDTPSPSTENASDKPRRRPNEGVAKTTSATSTKTEEANEDLVTPCNYKLKFDYGFDEIVTINDGKLETVEFSDNGKHYIVQLRGRFAMFSNLYVLPEKHWITMDGKKYNSIENAFRAAMLHPKDRTPYIGNVDPPKMRQQMLPDASALPKGVDAKEFSEWWNGHTSENLMKGLVHAKISQYPAMRELLRNSKISNIIHGNDHDTEWGCVIYVAPHGSGSDKAKLLLEGKNKLGKILMQEADNLPDETEMHPSSVEYTVKSGYLEKWGSLHS